MIRVLLGIFVILHGGVHALYAGHSLRRFEMQPGMAWPDRSWFFSRLLAEPVARQLAAVTLLAVTLGFAVGGVAILARQGWSRHVVVAAGIASTAIIGCAALNCLELFVAFLQAYIFVFLTSMFIGAAVSPEH